MRWLLPTSPNGASNIYYLAKMFNNKQQILPLQLRYFLDTRHNIQSRSVQPKRERRDGREQESGWTFDALSYSEEDLFGDESALRGMTGDRRGDSWWASGDRERGERGERAPWLSRRGLRRTMVSRWRNLRENNTWWPSGRSRIVGGGGGPSRGFGGYGISSKGKGDPGVLPQKM